MVPVTSVSAPSADCLKDGLDQVSLYELYLCHTSLRVHFRRICLGSVLGGWFKHSSFHLHPAIKGSSKIELSKFAPNV